MAIADRTIAIVKLFTLERPHWTVEDASIALEIAVSSAYRYFAALTEAGFLVGAGGGQYMLGPAIIELDRQIQMTDPLLTSAKPVMAEMLAFAPSGSTVLLCRLFRDTALCVHETASAHASPVSYQRGRPMPLFRGASSKVILAHLQSRDLRRLQQKHAAEIAAANLGDDWQAFRSSMSAIRKAGHCVAHGEVDPGCIGIAVALMDDRRKATGSLSFVIPAAEERIVPRLISLAATAAKEIEEGAEAFNRRPSE